MLPRDVLHELQRFVWQCKKSELDKLVRLTNLPRIGLKCELQLRLLSYLEQDPSTTFLSTLQSMKASHVAFSSPRKQSLPPMGSLDPYVRQMPQSTITQSDNGRSATSSNPSRLSGSANPALDLSSISKFSELPSQSNNGLSVAHPSIALAGINGCFRLPSVLRELRFIDSPFFKPIDTLLPPQVMIPGHIPFATGRRSYERSVSLRFTCDQAETITYHCHRKPDDRMEFGVQVVMRFARLNPDRCKELAAAYKVALKGGSVDSDLFVFEPYEDSLPIHLGVVVNGQPVQLPPLLPSNRPGLDGRRNPRPINITQFLRVSPAMPNHIKLTWTHDYSSFVYNVVAIYLMHKRSPQQLCAQLKDTAFRSIEAVKEEIIQKLRPPIKCDSTTDQLTDDLDRSQEIDDDLIISNILPAQLLCPLSKCRIEVPIRGKDCQHIQCYDATTYLLMNERKPSWKCPVCDKNARFDDLFVDGLFSEVIRSTSSENLDEVLFHDDGTWTLPGKIVVVSSVDNRDDEIEHLNPTSSNPTHSPSESDTQYGSSLAPSFRVSPSTGSTNSSVTSHPIPYSPTQRSVLPNLSSENFQDVINGLHLAEYHHFSAPTSQSAVTIDLTVSDDDDEDDASTLTHTSSNANINPKSLQAHYTSSTNNFHVPRDSLCSSDDFTSNVPTSACFPSNDALSSCRGSSPSLRGTTASDNTSRKRSIPREPESVYSYRNNLEEPSCPQKHHRSEYRQKPDYPLLDAGPYPPIFDNRVVSLLGSSHFNHTRSATSDSHRRGTFSRSSLAYGPGDVPHQYHRSDVNVSFRKHGSYGRTSNPFPRYPRTLCGSSVPHSATYREPVINHHRRGSSYSNHRSGSDRDLVCAPRFKGPRRGYHP